MLKPARDCAASPSTDNVPCCMPCHLHPSQHQAVSCRLGSCPAVLQPLTLVPAPWAQPRNDCKYSNGMAWGACEQPQQHALQSAPQHHKSSARPRSSQPQLSIHFRSSSCAHRQAMLTKRSRAGHWGVCQLPQRHALLPAPQHHEFSPGVCFPGLIITHPSII